MNEGPTILRELDRYVFPWIVDGERRRIMGVVSPQEFGAVGDGVADDTSAFQAAIQKIQSLGGGVLYIPSGDYLVSQSAVNYCLLVDDDNVSIVGERGLTRIVASEADVQLLRVESSNFTIRGVTFLGVGGSTPDGGHGLLQITGTPGVTKNINVLDCEFIDPDIDGVAISACEDVRIIGCYAENCPKTALYLTACVRGLVANNVVHDFGGSLVGGSPVGAAIQLSSNEKVVACNNVIETGVGSGILCNANAGGAKPVDNVIKGNVIKSVDNPTNINVASGIRLANSNADRACATIVAGNLIRACGPFAIEISNHNGVHVEGNSCVESNRNGITVGSIDGALVINNYVVNCGVEAGTWRAIELINNAENVIVGPNIYRQLSSFAAATGQNRAFDSSTGVANQLMKARHVTGVATIVNGTTSILVTTGITVAASNVENVSAILIESLGAATEWWIDGVTTSQFRINVDVDPGKDVSFAWSFYD